MGARCTLGLCPISYIGIAMESFSYAECRAAPQVWVAALHSINQTHSIATPISRTTNTNVVWQNTFDGVMLDTKSLVQLSSCHPHTWGAALHSAYENDSIATPMLNNQNGTQTQHTLHRLTSYLLLLTLRSTTSDLASLGYKMQKAHCICR